MSSIGSISAVSANPASSGAAAQKSSPAGNVSKNNSSAIGSSAGNNTNPAGASSRGICSNMSSSDFVSLTQEMGKGSGGMINPKEMINVMLALELLQKVAESAGELIDKIVSGK